MVTGNITAFNDNVRLSIKILDAGTAKLVGASKGNIPATKAIKDLLEKEIHSFDISDRSNDATGIKTEFKIRKKIEKEGFVFALQDCQRKQQKVRCEFLITSSDQDRRLEIFANRSYFLDNLGDSFYPDRIVLGNNSKQSSIYRIFYEDIPVKMVLEFNEIGTQSKVMSIFAVVCGFPGSTSFAIKFQNIPILKG